MTLRMVIAEEEYALEEATADGWHRLAVLPGGADALLPPTRAVDEGRLEMAIEVAEDWLMPHAAGLRGEVLEVADATGRLRLGMTAVLSEQAVQWSVEDVEGLFLRLVDLATGRVPSPLLEGENAFVADLLLLRELAHHGQVQTIRLMVAGRA